MYEEDHSLYGYLSRRSDDVLLNLLGSLKLEDITDYSQFIIDMIAEILTARGVDTNIYLSLVIPGGIPFFTSRKETLEKTAAFLEELQSLE